MEKAKHFFEQYFHVQDSNFIQLAQSGSSRKNFVASHDKGKFIVTLNENIAENESFFYYSQEFTNRKLNTPKIIAISEDRTLYIQEHVADSTLSELMAKDGLTDQVKQLVKESLLKLYQLQEATENIEYYTQFEYSTYDQLTVSNDLNYFKFLFADILEVPYHKGALLKEFQQLSEKIALLQPRSLMIRDFQARNIMTDGQHVYFIDYQSAMNGPRMYDVLSFLYQAKANFPESFRQEMINYYLSFFENQFLQQQLKESILPLRLIRALQVMGAYGFRGLVQKKSHFQESIKNGLDNLAIIIQHWPEINQYPELYTLLSTLTTESILQKIESYI